MSTTNLASLLEQLVTLVEGKPKKLGSDALADIKTVLGSVSERDRFLAKFDQVWDLADQDGLDGGDLDRAGATTIQDVIVMADELAQRATREKSAHAKEIRKFTMELKGIAKRRTG